MPRHDGHDDRLKIDEPSDHAAGVKGVAIALKHGLVEAGPVRTVRTFARLNQTDGFDCMSCAWPDPDPAHRHKAEFCENGAKAVAEEADTARVGPAFFAEHSIADLDDRTEFWLGKQGRLTHPMVKRPGDTHYSPFEWSAAYELIAAQLNALGSPHEALFYTSGRASNESAFTYQLFARAFGTNNLPDCSNMCHESTSVALGEAIGIGKGSVSLDDMYAAELIVLAGQNPGTNHPRMLSALEIAKRRGAKILTINPLKEAGSTNFRNPQHARGVVGHGTDLSDLHLPIKINGDLALFQAMGHLLLEWGALDQAFIDSCTIGFDSWRGHLATIDWEQVEDATGLSRDLITQAARMVVDSDATIWCWAMGLTQHHNSVATIREVVNLALLRGDIGKKGAGLCPVRGHSNVQGDRTVGIWEKPPAWFLDNLQSTFGFEPPRADGHDTVEGIEAMLDGQAKVFIGLGGNFVAAAPDTELTSEAMRRTELTVHISTKLNRSHLVCGQTALILPTLGRTEKDLQATGLQFVTVEDSMSVVHGSRGRLRPASRELRSETSIVCDIAHATLGDKYGLDWRRFRDDYSTIRASIEQVIPGFDDYERRVSSPGGFVLPHPPRDSRTFMTSSGFAEFEVSAMDRIEVPDGHLVLQTFRSHDQFNTTIYGMDDRYRGIKNGRRVVFMNRRDIDGLGLVVGDLVDLIAHWNDDRVRRADGFRVVEYAIPRGSAAAYYPETNPLVPLGSTALKSNTPTSKSVVISVERSAGAEASLT